MTDELDVSGRRQGAGREREKSVGNERKSIIRQSEEFTGREAPMSVKE